MGSGANNVGRAHVPESMIVGLEGRSIASRTLNECEPQQLSADHPAVALGSGTRAHRVA